MRKSRDIILQALFSRSETGLLTGDSAPAMPSVGMSEIVNPKTTIRPVSDTSSNTKICFNEESTRQHGICGRVIQSGF